MCILPVRLRPYPWDTTHCRPAFPAGWTTILQQSHPTLPHLPTGVPPPQASIPTPVSELVCHPLPTQGQVCISGALPHSYHTAPFPLFYYSCWCDLLFVRWFMVLPAPAWTVLLPTCGCIVPAFPFCVWLFLPAGPTTTYSPFHPSSLPPCLCGWTAPLPMGPPSSPYATLPWTTDRPLAFFYLYSDCRFFLCSCLWWHHVYMGRPHIELPTFPLHETGRETSNPLPTSPLHLHWFSTPLQTWWQPEPVVLPTTYLPGLNTILYTCLTQTLYLHTHVYFTPSWTWFALP